MLLFHHPERLWALLLLLPLAGLAWAAWRWEAARRAALSDARLAAGLWTDGRPQNDRTRLRFGLVLGALLCGIVGWAGPFTPRGGTAQKNSGTDVLIALDASRSMLATDLQPDRLRRAVAFINRLADQLPDDRMGLIIFAGRAYLQVPLTTDRAAFRLALGAVRPELLPAQGTVVAAAIDLAAESFSQQERRARNLVLVSDGEDHDDAAADAVQRAVKRGIVLHAVGVGSPGGTTLYDASGQPKLDAQGTPVVTRLDEAGLQQLAKTGGGAYVRMRDAASTAKSIAGALTAAPASPAGTESSAGSREYFPLLLGASLLLLLLSRIQTTVRRLPRAAALVVVGLGCYLPAQAQRAALQQGDAQYRAGRWAEAAAAYRKATADPATRVTALYNLGNALYRMQQYEAAQQAYGGIRDSAAVRSRVAYNEGNAQAAQRRWEEAAAAYKNALRAQPGAADAQYNLSYALKHLAAAKKDASQKPQPAPQKPQQQPQQQSSKPDPGALSKAQAEKLLQALRQEERRILDRQKNNASQDVSQEKDW